MKDHSHSSIQAHSMGELFPCVIARVERYPSGMTAATAAPSTSWELTAYGRSEEYATRADAEQVARALLRDAVVRAAWSGRPIDAVDCAPRFCAGGWYAPGSTPDRSMGGYGDANPARSLRLVP